MMRWLRRFFWLGVLTGAGYGAYRALASRRSTSADSAPWSPSSPAPASSRTSPEQSEAEAAGPATRWVAPADGECPAGYPVKANDSSGIFHVPGGRFYGRTIPERCYANAQDAIADGYRPAKA